MEDRGGTHNLEVTILALLRCLNVCLCGGLKCASSQVAHQARGRDVSHRSVTLSAPVLSSLVPI